MDSMSESIQSLGMSKSPKVPSKGPGSRPRRAPPRLYVGEWLRRLGYSQVAIARAVEIGESHMTLIIQRKRYPSPGLLIAIAEAMGLTSELLRHPPPDEDTIRATAGIDPQIIARLGQNLLKN